MHMITLSALPGPLLPGFLALVSPSLLAGGEPNSYPFFSVEGDVVIDLADHLDPVDPLVQGSMAFADFDGMLLGSLVQIVDGSLYCTTTPYVSRNLVPLDPALVDAVDLTVLEEGSWEGNDLLVVSTSTGLVRVEQYGSLAGIFLTDPVTGSGAWAGARRLQTAPRVNGGPHAIWGLVGSSVLVGELSGNSITTTVLLSLPFAVHDLCLTDYDLDGYTDFCAMTAHGPAIYSQDLVGGPAPLRREFLSIDSGGVATFRSLEGTPATTNERVAYWYVETGSPLARLAVIDAALTETPVNLSVSIDSTPVDPVPFHIAAGDHDGDGGEDLMLQVDRQCALLLTNLSSPLEEPPSNHFGVGVDQYAVIELSSLPANPVVPGDARGLFVDIDREPGGDFILPLDAANTASVFTRVGETGVSGGDTYVSGLTSADLIASASSYSEDHTFPPGDPETGTLETFDLALDIPAGAIDPNGRDFSHLEVRLHHQRGPNMPDPREVTTAATQNYVHPLTGNANDLQQWVRAVPRRPDGTPIPDLVWSDEDHIWLRFRFVKFSGPAPTSGSITEPYADASRVYWAAFVLRNAVPPVGDPPSTTHFSYIEGMTPHTMLRLFPGPPSSLSDDVGDNAWVGGLWPYDLEPPLPTGGVLTAPARVVGGVSETWQ